MSDATILYEHQQIARQPKRLTDHRQETLQKASSYEQMKTKLAVWFTQRVGTMETAFFFALIAFAGLLGLLGKLDPFMFLLMSWVSQQFIQLVLLPIIMVGQNTLNHQQEVIAEEQYTTTVRLLERLEAQDEVLEASAQDIHAHIETLAAQNAELLRLIHISLKGNLYEQRGQISQSGLPVWESDDWDLSRNVHR